MIYFNSDYLEGAHPDVLRRLVETNMVQTIGYGCDEYCASAQEKIREVCRLPDADVHFLIAGTQTNTTVIAAALRPYQGVIAAESGHINCHESGAIESAGHKVIALDAPEGKISAAQVAEYVHWHRNDESMEHIVYPGMVYISYPTECGTLYTKAELTALYDTCRELGLYLYIDGARLGYGLTSDACDLTLPELARLCDVFYIGGTKVGALCGEAVVFTKGNKPKQFVTCIKQRGALLAKGRLLGIQFDTLFTDDLYFRISRHAIDMAEKLKEVIRSHRLSLLLDSPTNQQFVILEDGQAERLGRRVAFSFWEKKDDTHTVVRLATGWSTTENDLEELDRALSESL